MSTGYPAMQSMPSQKNRRGKKTLVIALLSVLAVMLIAGAVLAVLLMQDNVSHKYSVNPSLDALTRAVVELGAKDELTLTPQEMTDTVAYFSSKEVIDGHVRYKDIYFDVAEDQENALIVVPFQYRDIDLVLQLNASMALRTLSDERYFVFTVNQAKIGEVVIPHSLVDRYIQTMKKADYVRYENGEILIDTSFLSVDVMGKKITFQVLDLSVVPEGFHIRTESLSDFLITVISEYFSRETGLGENNVRAAIEGVNQTLAGLEGNMSDQTRDTIEEIKQAMVTMLADPSRKEELVAQINLKLSQLGQSVVDDVGYALSRHFDPATAQTVESLFGIPVN